MRMKLEEMGEAKGIIKKSLYILFLVMIKFQNMTSNALFKHLDQRGVMTSYWVINEDDEINYILKNSTVRGIMTDRPVHAKKLISSFLDSQKNGSKEHIE